QARDHLDALDSHRDCHRDSHRDRPHDSASTLGHKAALGGGVRLLFTSLRLMRGCVMETETKLAKNFLIRKNLTAGMMGLQFLLLIPKLSTKEAVEVEDAIDFNVYKEQAKWYAQPLTDKSWLPICVIAPHATARIRAQSGTFTLHGLCVQPMERNHILLPHITKIFIPYTATNKIRSSLRKMGITWSFVFPSLDSIAADIADEEMSLFPQIIDRYYDQQDENEW
ncbi:hypothetical protein, partial [Azospirillum argentinense]